MIEEITISDPEVLSLFKSEGKQSILKMLIQREMNIYDLTTLLKLNPGTVKRHLDQLLEYKLIEQTKEEENSWGVRMKFYRSVAKSFIVYFKWP